jgi:predicted nucleic acid-binding protein
MGTLESTLAQIKGRKVYFDTNVLAYIFGGVSRFMEVSLPFFEAIEQGHFKGYTGDITIGELLVQPLKNNDVMGVSKIKSFFDEANLITVIAHTRQDFEIMAQIRAVQNLKAFDAIQVATAIRSGCQVLVTGDHQMANRAPHIETININDFITEVD